MSTDEEVYESDESEEEDEVESRVRQALVNMWRWLGGRTFDYLVSTRMDEIYSDYCSYCHQQALDSMPRPTPSRYLHSEIDYERQADFSMGLLPTDEGDEGQEGDDELEVEVDDVEDADEEEQELD